MLGASCRDPQKSVNRIHEAHIFFNQQEFVLVRDLNEMSKTSKGGSFQFLLGHYKVLTASNLRHSLQLAKSNNPHARAYAYKLIAQRTCQDKKTFEKILIPAFKDTTIINGIIADGLQNKIPFNIYIIDFLLREESVCSYTESMRDSLSRFYNIKR